jgi:hypothetical protein
MCRIAFLFLERWYLKLKGRPLALVAIVFPTQRHSSRQTSDTEACKACKACKACEQPLSCTWRESARERARESERERERESERKSLCRVHNKNASSAN